MKRSILCRSSHGFSLIEVAIAMGIVAFVLVALMGLLSVGLNSGKKSSEDTQVASMASQLAGLWRNSTSNHLTPKTTRLYYFDRDGQQTNTTQAAAAFYACKVVAGNVAPSEIAADTTNLVRVQMIFTWPAHLPEGSRPNTNIVYATLPPR